MKTVRITVERGMVQDVQCPKGVQVVVHDYDTEGIEEDRVQKDQDGWPYIESVYEHEEDEPVCLADHDTFQTSHSVYEAVDAFLRKSSKGG